MRFRTAFAATMQRVAIGLACDIKALIFSVMPEIA